MICLRCTSAGEPAEREDSSDEESEDAFVQELLCGLSGGATLFKYQSIQLVGSVTLSICLSICLYLSIYLSLSLPFVLCLFSASLSLSLYVSLSLSIYIPVYMYIHMLGYYYN